VTLSHEQRAIKAAWDRVKREKNRERRQSIKAQRPAEKRSRGRERDAAHLAFVRRLPCVTCLAPAPNDAAHIRMASPERGKLPTGMQVKPSDRSSVPLCRTCHSTQHGGSEARFWSERGIDPFAVADRLYAVSGDDAAATLVIRAARELAYGPETGDDE
jgi:hypothetical protein